MSAEAPQGTVVARNPLLGFGKVTTRLSGLLALIFIGVNAFPSALVAVALIPANTMMVHFFVWNMFTASFVETGFFGVLSACGATLLVGKQLEPLWGSKEFLRFILAVSATAGTATFFTQVFMYAASAGYMYERFLRTPIHGYSGLIGAYLVAVKQLLPQQQNKVCGALKIKSKDLAPLYIVIYTAFFLLGFTNFGDYVLIMYSTFFGWLYLRFFQPRGGGVVGDQHNDDFAFVEFFPHNAAVRRVITLAATACFRVAESCPCCKTMHVQKRNASKIMSHAALPGHTQSQAEIYRQRAMDLLDQKLADTNAADGPPAKQEPTDTDVESGKDIAMVAVPPGAIN